MNVQTVQPAQNDTPSQPRTAMDYFNLLAAKEGATPDVVVNNEENKEKPADIALKANPAPAAEPVNEAVLENKPVDEKDKTPDQPKEKFERHWDSPENEQTNEVAPDQELSKQKEIESQLNELKSKQSQYEELIQDDLIKAIHTGRKAGKDVTTILKELSGVDAEALSYEQLYESKLRRTIRLTDEDKKAGKSLDDVVAEEMEGFKGLSRAKKALETEDERDRIKKEDAARFAKYSESNQAAINKNNEWRDKAIDSMNQFVDSVKGKKYFGVTMTEPMLEKVKQMMLGDFNKNFYKSDGSYNTKFAFERSFEAVPELRKLMWDTAEKNIRADEREKVLSEYQRTDSNIKPSFTAPSTTDKKPTKAIDWLTQ